MATLYLKAAGGNFNGANWSTTGSAGVDSVTPTAADNCIAELGSGNLTINSGSVCGSLNCTTGTGTYVGVITHTAAVDLTIGDDTSAAGNVALNLAGTYNLGNATTSAIVFASTSGTQQTITTGGKTLGNTTYSGVGSSYLFGDNYTSTGTLTFSNGTLNTNSKTVSILAFSSTSGATRVYTFGTSSITCTGGGTAWSVTNAGQSGTISSSTITLSASGAGFTGGTLLTYGTVVFTGAGSKSFSTGANLTALTVTGTAALIGQLSFAVNPTISGAFTITANSDINRILILSSSIGTPRTITAGSVVIANTVDFQDITGAGTATWTVAGTGATYIGDCGGNSGITPTTAATQTATGTASFTWSTHGWTSRVPLPQDNVVVNNAFVAGRTVTMDMPRLGKSLDFSGATGSPTLQLLNAPSIFGSLILGSGLGTVFATSINFNFAGRDSDHIITSAGKAWGGTALINFNNAGGVYTLTDNMDLGTARSVTLTQGTLNLGDKNLKASAFSSTGGVSRTLTFGAGTLEVTGTGNAWNVASTITINRGTGRIKISAVSASTITFTGSGKTYPTVEIVTGGAGAHIFNNQNTYKSLEASGGSTALVHMTAGLNQTLDGGASSFFAGTAGNLITIKSTADGSAWTLTSSTRIVTDYISLQDSTASGAVPFVAGANSTLGTGNTNWVLTYSSGGNLLLMGV